MPNVLPPPPQVVQFIRSKKRKPHKGRSKFFGVFGGNTQLFVGTFPSPIQVVHFTGSKIRRGIPRKGLVIQIRKFGKSSKAIKPASITIKATIRRRQRLPQVKIQIGKIPRHFSNIPQPTHTLPTIVIRVTRRRTVPGRVLLIKRYGKPFKGVPIRPLQTLLQERPKRTKTRGKIKWIHGGGIVTNPQIITSLPPPPIQVVQFTGNRRIRLRPHTRITFLDLFGFGKTVRPKVRPVLIIKQINRKRRLPFTKTRFTKVFGIKSKKPKALPIRVIEQLLKKRRLPKTKSTVGKVPRQFGVSNVGTSTEFRPTYRPRRR